MVFGHDLHPHGPRLLLSGRHHGLGHPGGALLAACHHLGGRLLRRGPGGGRATRAVLSWRLATTLEADSCVEALEEALERFGAPQIFNTDQGSQFTSEAFTDVLKAHTIDISMDGKGCWRDNVFVERLWRGVAIHLRGLHRRPEGPHDRYQHGWQGLLARQRVRRAAVALRQIRGGVSQGL
ncbi:hypothetical protein C4901_05675 [Acidiferrobacter sp. SPIII_3]|nr:hypothetical protein C4901_05675 [Acidiferrobacter sp. SPIII_3]